jgi:hypothetical protein
MEWLDYNTFYFDIAKLPLKKALLISSHMSFYALSIKWYENSFYICKVLGRGPRHSVV